MVLELNDRHTILASVMPGKPGPEGEEPEDDETEEEEPT
jgi:hypothetical protein